MPISRVLRYRESGHSRVYGIFGCDDAKGRMRFTFFVPNQLIGRLHNGEIPQGGDRNIIVDMYLPSISVYRWFASEAIFAHEVTTRYL